jgi:hypothetical protein
MLGAAFAAVAAPVAMADNILSPGDFILSIDNNRNLPGTFNTAGTETPAQGVDQNSATKYLNFGREMSGIIVQPAFGSAIVQSFRFTTANDGPERDPASYRLFGFNGAITSADNSSGLAEPWTLIQTGALSLSTNRTEVQTPVDVTNSTAYTAYKLVFPTLRKANAAGAPANPNSMQFADLQMFTAPAGGGSAILAAGDTVRGIDETDSAFPVTERPLEAIDGDKTAGSKYLNFGREGTGLIVTPSKGALVAKALRITTANDTESRDPSSYELYGTNSPILSFENSAGDLEPWTLISSGSLTLPSTRNTEGDIVPFGGNTTAYSSYKIIFPENKGPDTGTGSANSIQFSEIELFDQVPEPSVAALGLGAAGIGLIRRRRRPS